MVFRCQDLFSLLLIIFLWRLGKIKAYVDVCEYSPMTVFCNCEELSRDSTSYRVICTVFREVDETDSFWRSLGDSENISYLKLQPRLPIVLNYIPSDNLRRMPKLKVLKIQECSLGTLKSYAVSDYENLEELYLEGNDIKALEHHAISNLPKLKKLALTENSLQEILENSLSGLLELEILLLDRNNISRIETCAFCGLQNLKELELLGNQISDLTEYTFRGLRYLRRLDLYKNKIRILTDKIFHTMPRLIEIDLSENMISHISARAFVGLEKLQTLSLGNNLIKVLPDEVFLPLSNLRSVSLHQNHIEILQREVVDNLKNSRDMYFFLGFTENPYRCDCAMNWVHRYHKIANSTQFKRELAEVECKMENETLKILQYLKKADCKASVIKPRLSSSFMTNSITKSTDSVPVELNSQNNKPIATATANEATEEAYLSDVVNDKPDAEDTENSSHRLQAELYFLMCVSLLALIAFENRREI